MTRVQVTPPLMRMRARRYLRSHRFGRTPLRDYLQSFCTLGPTAVFGGFLRDIALRGAAGFASDIDVVVDCDEGALARHVCAAAGEACVERNRFGGYRLKAGHSQIDIWALPTTWAMRSGYCQASLDALPYTTFFNWDAIAYRIDNGETYQIAGYFEALQQRVLDLSLRENPNPLGMSVRALRHMSGGDVRISWRLADYVVTALANETSAGICAVERRSFGSPRLTVAYLDEVVKKLRQFVAQRPDHEAAAFSCPVQTMLPFDER